MASIVKKSLAREPKKFPKFGVILDSEKDHLKEGFLKLKEEFGLRDADLLILTCKEERKNDDVYQGLIFTRKDLNWQGKIRNGEILNFAREPLDVLISFTEKESKLATFLVSVSNADLKVGRIEDPGSAGLFDIVINTDFNEQEVFLMELKKYLRIINKTHNG